MNAEDKVLEVMKTGDWWYAEDLAEAMGEHVGKVLTELAILKSRRKIDVKWDGPARVGSRSASKRTMYKARG